MSNADPVTLGFQDLVWLTRLSLDIADRTAGGHILSICTTVAFR